MAASPIEDFLALENLYIAQINDANIEGLRKVYGSKNLATVTKKNQVTPSVAVVYYSYRVKDTDGRGCRAMLVQKWFTILSVKSADDTKNGKGVREIAGPMIMDLINALKGWKPGAGYGTTRIVTAPRAIVTATTGDFPIGWETELYI